MFFVAAFLGENVRVDRFATGRALPDWGIGTFAGKLGTDLFSFQQMQSAGGSPPRCGGWGMKTPMKQILEQALKDFEGALKADKRKYHYTPNTIDNRVRGARAFVGYLLGEEWRKFIPGKGKRLQVPLFQ